MKNILYIIVLIFTVYFGMVYDSNTKNIIQKGPDFSFIKEGLAGLSARKLLLIGFISAINVTAVRIILDNSTATGMVSNIAVLTAMTAALFSDLNSMTIPNIIPVAILAIKVMVLTAEFFFLESFKYSALNSLMGLALCFLIMLIGNRLTHGGIGFGDIKLYASIGFAVGFGYSLLMLSISIIVAWMISIILLLSKKKTIKDTVPFVPFMYAGNIILLHFLNMGLIQI